jgi:hypothetical protein
MDIRKLSLTSAGLILGLVVFALLAAGGQPETPDAEDPFANWPTANPADVESIEAIVNAMYALESGAKGTKRDWDRLKALYHPDGRLVPARPAGDAGANIYVIPVDTYIETEKKYIEGAGFFAKDVHRRVDQFGNIAHVLSTYEYRRSESETTPYLRGLNSIQLVRKDNRWWIVTVFWDFERQKNPLPEQYLPAKEGG